MRCKYCKSVLEISSMGIHFCGKCGKYQEDKQQDLPSDFDERVCIPKSEITKHLNKICKKTVCRTDKVYGGSWWKRFWKKLAVVFLIVLTIEAAGYFVYVKYFRSDVEQISSHMVYEENHFINDEAREFYTQGKKFAMAGEYDLAIENYKLALEVESSNTYVREAMAFVYGAYLKDYDLAIEVYDEVLSIDPVNSNALYNRGITYRKMGNYDNAILDLKLALENAPEDKFARLYLVKSYFESGDVENAKAEIEKALELDPLNVEFLKLKKEMDL